jgi:UDP-N-acetyl-D-mannosaminuronic acid dehydrogenase
VLLTNAHIDRKTIEKRGVAMHFETISIIGLGYIGLPTAAVFAAKGKKVIGVDVNEKAVQTINHGGIHIVEPGLEEVVRKAVAEGHLRATMKPEPADAFLIAVPTPFKDGHQPDLSYVESAASLIAPVLRKGNLVVLESTSPVGTTEKIAEWLAEARPDLSFPPNAGEDSDIRIAHCPERVLPGKILYELVHNDRVIGGLTPCCSQAAASLYKIFVKGECILTSAPTAEMCKLTENSFRDVNIAFANELSIICDKHGINVWELIRLANRHPRVNILQPGPGVGGHCIAVDPWFIVSQAPEEARLIRTAREVNDSKPEWVVSKVKEVIVQFLKDHPEKTEKDVTVACFGLAFKPDIDDLRESPAIHIVEMLEKTHSGKVLVVEPHITFLPSALKTLYLVDMVYAINNADILLMLVDHSVFKTISKNELKDKIKVDCKGLWE